MQEIVRVVPKVKIVKTTYLHVYQFSHVLERKKGIQANR